ncbi:MAG TPA: esterase-like activity of phytase family protein [Sandaracinaceae bacterium LLY-WYZ-13_1]|nr:esterase-like activity of phytase family protein [Sandaracinaceae bacterium LLY-WYZ-13_1]
MRARCRSILGLAALAALLLGCDDEPRPLPEGVERTAVDTPDGLSGLARDGDGRLWAVAESERWLVRLDGAVPRRVPLEGVPEGLDTESIAWIEGDRFALGTESMDESRDADLILVVRVDGERARVLERLALPYAAVGVEAEENHGIEALCVAGGRYYAVLENVITRGGARHAPLAVYDPPTETWRAHRIRLRTETGKIAALACRTDGDGETVAAHAVERHFDVMRIHALALPTDAPSGRTLVPREVRVLDERLEDDPNLEGLEYDGDDVVLVTDNHHGRRTGPTELVRVRLTE